MAPQRALNPLAREFRPASSQPAAVTPPLQQQDNATPLDDLPVQVLADVCGRLEGVADLLACQRTCKRLSAAVAEAPTRVALTPAQLSKLSNPHNQHMLSELVQVVAKRMPGSVSVSLAGVPLEVFHLHTLLPALPHLHTLDLSGCKKLTAAATATLLELAVGEGCAGAAAAGDGSEAASQGAAACVGSAAAREVAPLAELRQLQLQRCFQLTDRSLTHVLALAAGPCGALECITASHLYLWEWPSAPGDDGSNSDSDDGGDAGNSAARWPGSRTAAGAAAADVVCAFQRSLADAVASLACHAPLSEFEPLAPADAATDAASLPAAVLLPSRPPRQPLHASGLRVLVLTNCSQLRGEGLLALAAAAPRLEVLMLGGSTLLVEEGLARLPAAAALEAALGLPEELTQAQLREHLLEDHTYLQQQRQASSSGSRAADAAVGDVGRRSSFTWGIAADSASRSRAGRLGGDVAPSLATMVQAVPGLGPLGARSRALTLALAASLLPKLRVLELTFHGPHVQAWLAAAFESPSWHAAAAGRAPPRVWDMCRPSRLAAAAAMLADHGGTQRAPALASALRCALNCSSRSRATPLHLCAYRGSPTCTATALRHGALHAARDAAGAEPLFLAAEAGNAEVAAELLAAGADPRAPNTAGESPLYISALRGHLAVVQLLLGHLEASGTAWQDCRLYGDAWTPLMAATVANRTDVALCLLRAAGAGAPALIAAANRYGQTVMHISARKSPRELLQLLLQHGGAAVLGRRDASGETPVEVARRNGHDVALHEFRSAAMACAVGA